MKFCNREVITERWWPDHSQIQAEFTRQKDAKRSAHNYDLYPSNDVEETVYYKMEDEDVKLERTDRKYPVKSNYIEKKLQNYLRACSSNYV